jgi:hypothetical protein
MEGRVPLSGRCIGAALGLGLLLAGSEAAASEPTKQECVSANESAQDSQHAGKLREARARLAVCVAESCPGPVREDCAQRLSQVDAAMPMLVFEARDEADHDVIAVRVTMDGQPFADKLDGTAIPVDPGPHLFELEAEGLRTETRNVVIREGDKGRHERVAMVAATPPPGGTATAMQSPEELPASDGAKQRMIGLVLGGAGVVGVAIGGIFGLVSKSTYESAQSSECGSAVHMPDNQCSSSGVGQVHSAFTQATVSTIGFIGGALLLGGGAYVYLTAPKGRSVSVGPAVGAGGMALEARGAW